MKGRKWLISVGASGSGKSTLMNIIGLLDKADGGDYSLNQRNIAGLDEDELASLRNQKIGFVFQQFNLLSRFNAKQNVALPLIYRNLSAYEIEERVMMALARVGMQDFAAHKPNQLSGGQQQRVAIARALVGEPQVILADESLARIINIQLARGHFVSFVESFEYFCVIGDGLVRQIKQVTMDEPIDKQLRIGQVLYTIIGVAEPWHENAFFNEDINQSVIIPVAGFPMVNRDSKINNAIFLLKPGSPIDKVIEQIKNLLIAHAPAMQIYPRSAKQIIASIVYFLTNSQCGTGIFDINIVGNI